jgi:nucleoside-diphosphate-sugar epimerase
MRWVERGWPLPLGSIHNARSLVSVWNLCDLLANVVRNPRAPGGTWLVSDGQDLSTTELVRRLGAAMQRSVTLLPIPAGVLAAGAALLGRRAEAARLCGSLVVDIAATVAELGWTPPVPVAEGLDRTAAWYLGEARAPAPAVE